MIFTDTRHRSVLLVAIALTLASTTAGAQEQPIKQGFVGTWAVLATSQPGGPPPFVGLFVLHGDGTISETNGAVHPSSAGAQFPFNGSDGYGTWSGLPGGQRIAFTFYKLLFDGSMHVGYLRVSGIFSGDHPRPDQLSGDTTVEIVFGLDPRGPAAQTLPAVRVDGVRLGVVRCAGCD